MNRFLVLSFVALAAAASTFCSKPDVEPEAVVSAPMSVQVETVKLEMMQATITVTGTVTPAPGADWTINAPERGRIVELPKNEGDAVKPGDLLAKFEIPSLTATIIASQSEMLQSTSRLAAATSAVTRLTGLVERGIAPQRDLDDAQRELTEAQAAMRTAEGNKAAADQLAASAVIRARFAGLIARRFHGLGDTVDGSAADPVLRVIDPTRLEIAGTVPSAELDLITPGQPAKIFNPLDGKEIAGTVINRQMLMEGSSPGGEVRVSFGAAAPAGLMVGSPIQVEITGDSRSNVLTVSRAAIFREGDNVFVVVAGDDGKAHHRNVKTGIVTRDKTQIISGLLAGDKVILSGADAVPDGTSITIAK